MFSTLGVFSTSGDTTSKSGDILSTSKDVQYFGDIMIHVEVIIILLGIFSTSEGYHEYIGGTMIHVEERVFMWRSSLIKPF